MPTAIGYNLQTRRIKPDESNFFSSKYYAIALNPNEVALNPALNPND